MLRYITTETLRGNGELQADGRCVATVLYKVRVEEGEEEFNGTWIKTGMKRFGGLSITPIQIEDRAALALGSELILCLDDGRRIPLMINDMDRELDGTPVPGFVAAGGWLPPQG